MRIVFSQTEYQDAWDRLSGKSVLCGHVSLKEAYLYSNSGCHLCEGVTVQGGEMWKGAVGV